MIDLNNSSPKSKMLFERNETHEISRVSSDNPVTGIAHYEFADKLRRLIASSPTMCVSAAFVIGGFLGWLTAKR